MQHGDIQIFRLIYAGGVYDYTEYVTITPPAGGGVLRFNPSTGYPEQMAVSADMMTLLSSADMASMKSAAGLIDSTAFTWANLPGKPSFFSGAYVDLTGKPTYATVATSGSYNDLSNKPSIPTIPGNATTSVSGLLSAADKTKLDGLSSYTLPSTGTAGTYGSVTTDAQGRVTSGKRCETYSGTTNASGVVTVTFGTAFSAAPNIQANLINGADNQNLRITSITTTGFTVLARTRTDVVGLLPTWANAPSLAVDILITEK